MKEFTVFGITTKTDKCYRIDDVFKVIRDIDIYGDECQYLSRETYRHDAGDGIRFSYNYVIEAHTNADDGPEKTWYTLCLVPTPGSLSKKKRKSVRNCMDDNPDIMDVFDYGCYVVMAQECHDGSVNMDIMNNIANVVGFIDNIRGFFLDRYQNRIGTTGWDLLNDFIKDVDFVKASINRLR